MRLLLCVMSFLFNLSLNPFPLAWVDHTVMPRLTESVKRTKTAVSTGIQKAGDVVLGAREKRMKSIAIAQWEPGHKKRLLRTKVNMTKDEKPEFVLFFAHGYRPKTTGYDYSREKALTMVAPFLRSFRYVMYHPLFSVGPAYTTFGQKDDIEQLKFHLDRIIALTKDSSSDFYQLPIVCVGHSNGAATLISLFGTYPELAKNVSMALLFAAYADVRKTKFFHTLSQKILGVHVSNFGPRGAGLLYNSKEKAPIDFIQQELFPKGLPVFLVHAKDDPYVPLVSNFTLLSRAFRTHGYEEWLELCAFDRGGHGNFLMKSTKEDRQKLRDSLKKRIDRIVLKGSERALPLVGVSGIESPVSLKSASKDLVEQMLVDARCLVPLESDLV